MKETPYGGELGPRENVLFLETSKTDLRLFWKKIYSLRLITDFRVKYWSLRFFQYFSLSSNKTAEILKFGMFYNNFQDKWNWVLVFRFDGVWSRRRRKLYLDPNVKNVKIHPGKHLGCFMSLPKPDYLKCFVPAAETVGRECDGDKDEYRSNLKTQQIPGHDWPTA